MNRTLLLASATALVLCAGGVASAKSGLPSSASPTVTFAKHTIFKARGVTLYDQNSNDSGHPLDSSNFDSGSLPTYSNQGADDFTVPAGHSWRIHEVDVTGVYFNGPGPTDGVNVFFYEDNGGVPGNLKKEIIGAKYTDNGSGGFAIRIGYSNFKAGKYWVSVQADMNFGSAGEWGWEVSSVQSGNPAMWQNPGNGFHACATWGTTQSCQGVGPDLMFALKGRDVLLTD